MRRLFRVQFDVTLRGGSSRRPTIDLVASSDDEAEREAERLLIAEQGINTDEILGFATCDSLGAYSFAHSANLTAGT